MNRSSIEAEVHRIRERLRAKGSCPRCAGVVVLWVSLEEHCDGTVKHNPPPAPCPRCDRPHELCEIIEVHVQSAPLQPPGSLPSSN
jgi:hypothetical protein